MKEQENLNADKAIAKEKMATKERKPRQLTVEQITNQASGLSNADFSQLIQNLDKMKEERREKAKQELEALG